MIYRVPGTVRRFSLDVSYTIVQESETFGNAAKYVPHEALSEPLPLLHLVLDHPVQTTAVAVLKYERARAQLPVLQELDQEVYVASANHSWECAKLGCRSLSTATLDAYAFLNIELVGS